MPAFAYAQYTAGGLILTSNQSAPLQLTVDGLLKVSGSSGGGDATSANQLAVIGTKAPGVAATNSELMGGVYISAGITLLNAQQAALQLTSVGALQTNDVAVINAITAGVGTELPTGGNNIGYVTGLDMEPVDASATNQVLGGAGATGDYLSHVTITPEALSAGTVSIRDGAGTVRSIFVTGTLSNLVPFTVALGAKSTGGAWQVSTGLNVHCFAFGTFSA